MTGTIYGVRAGRTPFVKVGWADDLDSRIRNLQTGNHEVLRLTWSKPGSMYREKLMHLGLASKRHRGEWFDFGLMTDDEVAGELSVWLEWQPRNLATEPQDGLRDPST